MAKKLISSVQATETGLTFTGVIDHQSVPKLLRLLPAFKVKNTVFDLSNVSKIDSAGLAFLVHLRNEHLPSGNKLNLKGASAQALQLINIMQLETVFDLG